MHGNCFCELWPVQVSITNLLLKAYHVNYIIVRLVPIATSHLWFTELSNKLAYVCTYVVRGGKTA